MLTTYQQVLQTLLPLRWSGRVTRVSGQTVESEGPMCSVGDVCELQDREGRIHVAEAVGFHGRKLVMMPLRASHGIRMGDRVYATRQRARIAVGEGMIGRVLDATGRPIDGLPMFPVETYAPLECAPHLPLQRKPIHESLGTGVRVIDSLLTVGRGQRMGIFGGSGVGKSTLIGMMARNAEADVTVIGLIGERGREVPEFLHDALGARGMRRSVTVASTSDDSPLMRMRGALTATAIAEYFAARGKRVLLVLDSLTRYAMAAREYGLAAGEPPVSRGYTPSVFTRLAQLVERAGNFQHGSITAFYTVLMEGDDVQDVIVDAVRSLLDGHIMLSREQASEGWFPPVDIVGSLSRLMPAITAPQHREHAMQVRRLLSAHQRSIDMVRLGMYRAGSDAEVDQAIRAYPMLRGFAQQKTDEFTESDTSVQALADLPL